jgi:hypothetical protein
MNPLAIYQQALDAVSAAVMEGDFARYAARIDLPYLVVTEAASLIVTTLDELRPTFDNLIRTLRARGVTHYERVARAADFVQPMRIEGRHYTHLIAGGAYVARPQSAEQALVRRGDRWLFSDARYPIRADRWPLAESELFPDADADAGPGRGLGAACGQGVQGRCRS